jgi:MFS family permease
MIALPFLLKYFKPAPSPIHLDRTDAPPQPQRSSVDVMLMRGSLLLEIISFTGLTFVKHPVGYIIFSICGSFGSGVSPAAHSISLETFSAQGGQESGRLFGAFSVLQALSSQIIGPSLFGYVYMSTVATFPSAIFLLSAICVIVAFVFSCFVNDPAAAYSSPVPETLDEEP